MDLPPKESLISRAQSEEAKQMKLFTTAQMPSEHFEKMEAHGHFTGERLFRFKPEIYRMITCAIAEGLSVRQISRAFGVSTNTVMAVRDREPEAIDTEKRKVTSELRKFARMAIERLNEEIDHIDIDKLPIALGIVVEKWQLLEGQATSRVEHVKTPGIEDYNRIIDALPVEPESIGFNSGKPEQKASPELLTSQEIIATELQGDQVTDDCESVVRTENNAADTGLDTGATPADDAGPENDDPENEEKNAQGPLRKPPGSRFKRGGGGRQFRGGGQFPTGSGV